jgi:hypothetical protein
MYHSTYFIHFQTVRTIAKYVAESFFVVPKYLFQLNASLVNKIYILCSFITNVVWP